MNLFPLRQSPLDTCLLYTSIVETDNRLCRLRNGIVYHKYDRKEVAGDAEGRHTVFFQIMDEYKIAYKHHAGNSHFTQKGR